MRVKVKNIICSTDFSDYSNHAVPYSIALAKEFGAKLYMCHIIEISSAAIYGEFISESSEQQIQRRNYAYEQLNKLMGEYSVEWEPLITTGNVANEIARLAKEKCVDMAITATHGRSGLKRLILGSVTERLMRTLPCPLLAVRSREQDSVPSAGQNIRLERILVGCDFSPDSNLAFQYGLSLAQEFQSQLYLTHVIEPPVYKDFLKSAMESGEAFRRTLDDQLNEKLKNMVPEEARNWCTPKTILLAGRSYEEITKYAGVHEIDLIVLGIRGHGLVETLLIGSTTDRVVRQAPCPVLSVSPAVKFV